MNLVGLGKEHSKHLLHFALTSWLRITAFTLSSLKKLHRSMWVEPSAKPDFVNNRIFFMQHVATSFNSLPVAFPALQEQIKKNKYGK